MKTSRSAIRLLTVVMALSIVGAACGDGRTQQSAGSSEPSGASVSVENAGTTVTLSYAPQRIVSLYPTMTDLLIRLGVGDRIVGQAGTAYASAASDTAAEASHIRVLADSEVNRETLLSARPDLVVADQEYHFSGIGLPSRKDLAQLGIPVYINQALWEPTKVQGTVEQSLNDITDLGKIVRSPRAAQLRRTQQEALNDQRRRVADVPALRVIEVTVFDRQIYAHAGGLYGDVLRQAKATNLVPQSWMPPGDYQGQVPVEKLASLAPDVIVYSYRAQDDKGETRRQLAAAFGATPAGQRGAFVGLAESATGGGSASVNGVGELIDGLAQYRR